MNDGLHTSAFVPEVGSLRFWHSARRPATSRGRFNAGRSEVSREEKVAGPVICRPRVCLLAARCLRARDEAREACMINRCDGDTDEKRDGAKKFRKDRTSDY